MAGCSRGPIVSAPGEGGKFGWMQGKQEEGKDEKEAEKARGKAASAFRE